VLTAAPNGTTTVQSTLGDRDARLSREGGGERLARVALLGGRQQVDVDTPTACR
jgi:hypothetical protein